MLTWVCGRTSCQPSELASPHSARFVASDVHCQDMPGSHWYTHSWWARLTTATRSLPEWPEIFSTGCSPFWTPPLDSCFRRGNSTESRRCFANCTGNGWRFRRGSNTGYAYWPTGACTAPRRHTSPSRSNWQLCGWSTTSPFCQLNDFGRSRNTSLDVKAAPSLVAFQRRLKLPLFHASFPDDW